MEDDRQIVRIICRQNEDYSLSIHGGKIVFLLADRRNRYQYWIKDDRHRTSRKDSEGQPAFALVNSATGEAIKHCPNNNPVSLIPYNPDSVDDVLWTVPKDMDHGFTNIRRMDDISLIFTADSPNVHEGRLVRLCHFVNINNYQRWKIVPYADNLTMDLPYPQPMVKIYCQTKVDYNLTVSNDAVMLAPADPTDKYQYWIKETTYCQHVKDEENRAAFALVNKATGKAIKHGIGHTHLVRLAPFDRNCLDVSVLWTESGEMGNGFRQIRMQTNPSLVLDALDFGLQDWALLMVLFKNGHSNQNWKIEEFK